jgi:redox-sensitive bicupin YhaK (pirin superfamily)
MRYVVHTADSRGNAEHGWLHSRHTFSFASYHDPQRMGFGKLRVINDDMVISGAGFGTHSHANMEIISVALAGSMRHRDSMGNSYVIKQGEVQVMSAGTGISHSEYNASDTEPLNFLQIWVLPKLSGIEPRYEQKHFSADGRNNEFQAAIVPDGSPDADDGALRINQDAWFSFADFTAGRKETYQLKMKNNGAYVFLIEGQIEISGESLGRRDGIGIIEAEEFTIDVISDCQLLIIDAPP